MTISDDLVPTFHSVVHGTSGDAWTGVAEYTPFVPQLKCMKTGSFTECPDMFGIMEAMKVKHVLAGYQVHTGKRFTCQHCGQGIHLPNMFEHMYLHLSAKKKPLPLAVLRMDQLEKLVECRLVHDGKAQSIGVSLLSVLATLPRLNPPK